MAPNWGDAIRSNPLHNRGIRGRHRGNTARTAANTWATPSSSATWMRRVDFADSSWRRSRTTARLRGPAIDGCRSPRRRARRQKMRFGAPPCPRWTRSRRPWNLSRGGAPLGGPTGKPRLDSRCRRRAPGCLGEIPMGRRLTRGHVETLWSARLSRAPTAHPVSEPVHHLPLDG
jgi:hypothetical protein